MQQRTWSDFVFSLVHLDTQCSYLLTEVFESQFQKTYIWTYTPSEDSDQLAHSHRLIRIFTERILDSQGSKVSLCGQRRYWRWAHTSVDTFSPIAAHFIPLRLQWALSSGPEYMWNKQKVGTETVYVKTRTDLHIRVCRSTSMYQNTESSSVIHSLWWWWWFVFCLIQIDFNYIETREIS